MNGGGQEEGAEHGSSRASTSQEQDWTPEGKGLHGRSQEERQPAASRVPPPRDPQAFLISPAPS